MRATHTQFCINKVIYQYYTDYERRKDMKIKRRNIFTDKEKPDLDKKTQHHLSDFTQNLNTMSAFYRKASIMIAVQQMEQELQETSQPSPPHNLRTNFIKLLKSGCLYLLEKLFPGKDAFETQSSNTVDADVINIIPQANQKEIKK